MSAKGDQGFIYPFLPSLKNSKSKSHSVSVIGTMYFILYHFENLADIFGAVFLDEFCSYKRNLVIQLTSQSYIGVCMRAVY